MDATAANIEVSRDDFLQYLRATKLVDDAELEKLANSDADVLAIANSLLASGVLTDFQIDAISQGRPAELRVGNYDILARLGAGGMGTVFKARHRRMKRIVALKVLAASMSNDAAFVQRFQREVETIARLGHPNVVMAYDADEADIGHFLVMEFVDGKDLASFVEKNGPLSVSLAINCILQAARGLAYAHGQGIIHRDIKPHNLLRDPGGTVKVTDLGLARLTSSTDNANSALTQAGGILGTADYMPPEQAVDSAATDHRADIYSLGCTLYFLLAGGPPYVGQSIMSTLLKHREAPIPSLTEVRADVPPELDRLFRQMVAKSVADRLQTMEQVVAALETIAAKVGFESVPVGIRPIAPTSSASSLAVNKPNETTLVSVPTATPAMTVIIVEPSRVQAGIIRKYLEAQGIVVAGAVSTGQQTMEAIRANRPDAIVAALHLVDMTGIHLAQSIRTELPQQTPGFVLISSEADDAGSMSKLSRVVSLRKPFTPEQLVQCLKMVTNRPTSSDSSTGRRAKRSNVRVLIVDDSALIRRHERTILEALGFTQIVEAVDGARAIAAATQEPFDLIITDYNMPLMDGHAFVSYLKQTPATAAIPVVLVTTETDDAILNPMRALGVVSVFDKAFAPEVVGPVLDKLF